MLWDHFFVSLGVWYFSPDYILGTFIFGLPLEEILFMITLPIAFTSLYEWLQGYLKRDYLQKYSRFISWLLLLGLVPVVATQSDHIYTAVTAVVAIFMLLFQVVVVRGHYMGRFYIAYLIAVIPFLLLKAVYTGLPIILFQDGIITGIRLLTIPVEDLLYLLVFMQANIILHEWFKSWTKKPLVDPPDIEPGEEQPVNSGQ